MNRHLAVVVSRLALLMVGALVVFGCGPQAESEAQRIPGDDVPFGLLDGTPVESSPTTSAAPNRSMEVYFVRGNRLVPVERESERPSVIRAFEALANGPTAAEAGNGVRTAIPPGVEVPSLRASGATVVVQLDGPVAEASPSEQVLALAQMVYTATAFSGIDSVQFLIDGQPVDIPRADGTLTRGPVSRSDYQGLG